MPEQLRIEHAIAARLATEGMGRALDRAEAAVPAWGDLALDYIRRYASQHAEFPGFFVTMQAENDPNFPNPENERAWGGVWKRAAREGIVRATSKTMKHPRRHGCPALIWESLVWRSP